MNIRVLLLAISLCLLAVSFNNCSEANFVLPVQEDNSGTADLSSGLDPLNKLCVGKSDGTPFEREAGDKRSTKAACPESKNGLRTVISKVIKSYLCNSEQAVDTGEERLEFLEFDDSGCTDKPAVPVAAISIKSQTPDQIYQVNPAVNVVLTVEVQGDVAANIKYQWFRNNVALAGSVANVIQGARTFSNVGSYHVVVTNIVTGQVVISQPMKVSMKKDYARNAFCTDHFLKLRVQRTAIANTANQQLVVSLAGSNSGGMIGANCVRSARVNPASLLYRNYQSIFSESFAPSFFSSKVRVEASATGCGVMNVVAGPVAFANAAVLTDKNFSGACFAGGAQNPNVSFSLIAEP